MNATYLDKTGDTLLFLQEQFLDPFAVESRELRTPFQNQTKNWDCSYYFQCKGSKNLDGEGFYWTVWDYVFLVLLVIVFISFLYFCTCGSCKRMRKQVFKLFTCQCCLSKQQREQIRQEEKEKASLKEAEIVKYGI
jgi:hypothetical protein